MSVNIQNVHSLIDHEAHLLLLLEHSVIYQASKGMVKLHLKVSIF